MERLSKTVADVENAKLLDTRRRYTRPCGPELWSLVHSDPLVIVSSAHGRQDTARSIRYPFTSCHVNYITMNIMLFVFITRTLSIYHQSHCWRICHYRLSDFTRSVWWLCYRLDYWNSELDSWQGQEVCLLQEVRQISGPYQTVIASYFPGHKAAEAWSCLLTMQCPLPC
jgi:hypothetical protein